MSSNRVFLFWTKYDSTVDTDLQGWINRPIWLNPSHVLSLQAHLKFGHEVHLYTYQPLSHGIPENVTVHNATQFYPAEDAFSALSRGHSVAHISDIVRLRSAATHLGLVADMDAIVINQLPDLDEFYCTMPAKATGGVAPKWGKAHPAFTIHDQSWDGKALSAFPVKVSERMSRHIFQLSDKIHNTLSAPPKTDTKAWNYILWTLKEMSRMYSDTKIFPPLATCPVPSWLGPGKCYSTESPTRLDGTHTIFGYQLPSIPEIMTNSYIVQHFFESAWQNYSQDQTAVSFWYDIPHDSLLGTIAKQTVGDTWRTLLPSLSRTTR